MTRSRTRPKMRERKMPAPTASARKRGRSPSLGMVQEEQRGRRTGCPSQYEYGTYGGRSRSTNALTLGRDQMASAYDETRAGSGSPLFLMRISMRARSASAIVNEEKIVGRSCSRRELATSISFSAAGFALSESGALAGS